MEPSEYPKSKIHIGTFTGPAGTFRQRTELTKPNGAVHNEICALPADRLAVERELLGAAAVAAGGRRLATR